MQIYIKKKEKNPKGFWLIRDEKDATYSTWDEKVAESLVEGNTYDVEVKTTKKDDRTYSNINKIIAKVNWLDVPVTPPKTLEPIVELPEDRDKRYRSMALAYAKDIAVALIGTMKEEFQEKILIRILKTADKFYNYIINGTVETISQSESPVLCTNTTKEGVEIKKEINIRDITSQKIPIGKHAGKTWDEILDNPETRSYIFWAAHNAKAKELQDPAKKIIEAFPDEFSQEG